MTNMTLFIAALIAVESGGCDQALGDGGDAVGCLQIHRCVVDDINRIYNIPFEHHDMRDRKLSIVVCRLYLSHYATKERLGREPTVRDFARIWNGGPQGHLKESTTGYADRVEAIYQDLLAREEQS